MEAFMEGVTNIYSSERLYYRKAEEDDEHLREFLPQVEYDPSIQAFVSPGLMKPRGKADIDQLMKGLSNCFFAVSMCLRSEEGGEGDAKSNGQTNQLDLTKDKPTIIGVVLLGWGGIPPDVAINRRAEIGIMLASKYQDKGYGREAMNWMLDWAFRYAGLHTVALIVSPYNDRAVHLYKSMGFVQEGRRRHSRYFNRKWHDELLFGITEHEWEELRGISTAKNNE